MSVMALLKCDFCGADTSEPLGERWSVVSQPGTPHTDAISLDMCPSCFARLRGWKRPR